jgi:hypothetical protein
LDNLLSIALEAHSNELNHHRSYEILVGRDLLEHWTVTVRYGRVGSPAREIRIGTPDIDEARSLVAERLRRRLSAPRRIGCAYRIRALSLETLLIGQNWLPTGTVAQLLLPVKPER